MLPLRFVAAESFYPDGAGIDSILEISGAVRGRLRADGSIDVDAFFEAVQGAAAAPASAKPDADEAERDDLDDLIDQLDEMDR